MKGMQKIKRGVLFRGVLVYVFDRKNGNSINPGQLVDSNMAGQDIDELTKEFTSVRKQRNDIEKPVWHNSLRLPKGDKLTKKEWAVIAEAYLNLLGLDTSNFQYVCILHDDADGQHVHIIANRVGIDGSVFLGRNENIISTRVISELEKEFGLTATKNLNYTKDADGNYKVAPSNTIGARKEVKATKPELAMEKRKQEDNRSYLNPKTKLSRAINDALEGGATTEQFINRLEKSGIKVVANVSKSGVMNGFSFEIDDQTFKGSQVKASWSDLTKTRGLDYDKNRDNSVLQARYIGAAKPTITQTLNSVLNTESPIELKMQPHKPPLKLVSMRNRILTSVKPVQESTCRAMVCYEAPKIKKSLYGIDDNLTFNLPKNHIEAQACYSLRAVFGKNADIEFRDRSNFMGVFGLKYTWQDYYLDFNRDAKSRHGANTEWWRIVARMTYESHMFTKARTYVPEKYVSHFDDSFEIRAKKDNVLPDQPSSAIWVVNKPVEPEAPKLDEQKQTVEVQPVSKPQEPVVTESHDIPPPQQVEEAVPVKPFNPYPDPYRIPTPKPPNPWGSGGFNPW